MLKRWTPLTTLLAAGAAFVVLDVILGVTLWVSLLVAGCVLIGGGAVQLAAVAPIKVNPVADVRTLRMRFAIVVGLGLAAAFLVVASFAFAPSTVAVLGWTVGIGAALLSLALSPTLRRAGKRLAAWDAIAAAALVLSSWQIVQALVFGPTVARWLTFADALGLAGLALAALTLHELSTERVVHALELVERQPVHEMTPAGARG